VTDQFKGFKPGADDHEGVVSMDQIEIRRKAIVEALERGNVPIDLLTCLTIVVLGQSLEEEGFVVDIVPSGGSGGQVH
jgi:hypothetical protein